MNKHNLLYMKYKDLMHMIHDNGRHFVYGSVVNRLWELSGEEADILSAFLLGEDMSFIQSQKPFFDIESFIESICLKCTLKDEIKDDNYELPNSMVILVSECCNFACSYCYGVYTEKKGIMTKDVAFKAVDLASKLGIKDLVFFGGEPMLNFSLIKDIVEYVENIERNDSIKTTFRMTTNASLISEDIAKYFQSHNFEISVSMDGDRHSHDLTRVFNNHESSYDAVLNGINFLNKYDVLSLIEITYSARHRGGLAEQIRSALSLCPNVSVACVDGKEKCKHECDVVKGDLLFEFYETLLDYEKNELSEGQSLIGAKELYNKICNGEPLYLPSCICSDIGSRLIVAVNGNIIPCPEMTEMEDYIIDNINNISTTKDFLDKRKRILCKLSSRKVQRRWYTGLCETCIQHVSSTDSVFVYNDEKSFEKCIEKLILRFVHETDNE